MPRRGVARRARRGLRGRPPLAGRSRGAAGASLPSSSATASGEPAVESAVTAAAWLSNAEQPGPLGAEPHELEERRAGVVGAAASLRARVTRRAAGRARGVVERGEQRLPGGQHQGDQPAVEPARRAAARAEPRCAASRPVELGLVGDVSASALVSASRRCWNVGRQRGDASIQCGELGATGLVEARHRRARRSRWRRSSRYADSASSARRSGRRRAPRCGRRAADRAGSRRGGPRGEVRTPSRVASISSSATAELAFSNTGSTRRSRAPERSSATIVFSNVGGRGVVRDRLDLAALLGHAELERLAIVLGADEREQRKPEGQRARLEERVASLIDHSPTLLRTSHEGRGA